MSLSANNPLSYRGLEPNAILVKDYYGKENNDNELDYVLQILDELLFILEDELETITVRNDDDTEDIEIHPYVDFRYYLCNMEIPDDLFKYSHIKSNGVLSSSQRFLNDLKT